MDNGSANRAFAEVDYEDAGHSGDRVVTITRAIREVTSRSSSIDPTTILQTSGRLILVSDMAVLLIACIFGALSSGLADWLHSGGTLHLFSIGAPVQMATFVGLGVIALLWLDSRGHYRQRIPFWEVSGQVLVVAVVGFVASGFLNYAAHNPLSRLWLGSNWLLFGMMLMIGRYAVRKMLSRADRWDIPAIMIGEGPSVKATMRALRTERAMGFKVERQVATSYLRALTTPEAWHNFMKASGAGHVFLALDSDAVEAHRLALRALVRERLPCSFVPHWSGLPSTTLSIHHFMLHDVLLIHDTDPLSLPLPRMMKRMFDIVASLGALMVLWPLLLAVFVLVRSDGGPALFHQKRVGKNGKLFNCLKFRSMRVDAEEFLVSYLEQNPESKAEWTRFQKLKNDVRITRIGNVIRRASIDELPQLINVLLGHMSLVGPRPIMPEQTPLYGEDFSHYTSVRPGITGPWQVSGRNNLTFSERVALEATYARNWHFWMDVVIVIRTLPALLGKGSAY